MGAFFSNASLACLKPFIGCMRFSLCASTSMMVISVERLLGRTRWTGFFFLVLADLVEEASIYSGMPVLLPEQSFQRLLSCVRFPFFSVIVSFVFLLPLFVRTAV